MRKASKRNVITEFTLRLKEGLYMKRVRGDRRSILSFTLNIIDSQHYYHYFC